MQCERRPTEYIVGSSRFFPNVISPLIQETGSGLITKINIEYSDQKIQIKYSDHFEQMFKQSALPRAKQYENM
jgi:hypothetical protein